MTGPGASEHLMHDQSPGSFPVNLPRRGRRLADYLRSTRKPTNGAVNRAGEFLRTDEPHDAQQWREAITIIDQWRTTHLPPLQLLVDHVRKVATEVDPLSLVADRLKRLPSIRAKMRRRDPQMKLSTMDDIGGCRAVLKWITHVRDLERRLRENPPAGFSLLYSKDHIVNPSELGYRSLHLIFRCDSLPFEDGEVFKGLRFELQIRSRVQHAWATAVETAGLFRREELKAGEGAAEWVRFFRLAAALFASRELTPPVPSMPADRDELNRLITEADSQIRVFDKLSGYGFITNVTAEAAEDVRHCLFKLNLNRRTLDAHFYGEAQALEALSAYREAEVLSASNPDFDIVLVSPPSQERLQEAYPNYFADTRLFLDAVFEDGQPPAREPSGVEP